jgi:hypothetical protein
MASSADQKFEQTWNQIVSWAQDNNLPASSYTPVYQLDQQRLANGEQGMSVSEITRGIIAANNPDAANVTLTPSDQTTAGAVFSNARNDFRSIMTGLDPIDWPSEIKSLVGNTITDASKGNVSGLMTNSLFSVAVPGLQDLGMLTQYGLSPKGLVEGAKTLAEHPLIALLDIAPFGGSGRLARTVARTRFGGAVEAANTLGMTADQFKAANFRDILSSLPAPKRWQRPMLDPRTGRPVGGGGAPPVTVGAVLTKWAQERPAWSMLSKPVQKIMRGMSVVDERQTAMYQEMFAPLQALENAATPDDMAMANNIWKVHQEKGTPLDELLRDPKVSPMVRKLVEEQGRTARFLTEIHLASGDVVPVLHPDGSVDLFARAVPKELGQARDGVASAYKDVIDQLGGANEHVQAIGALEAQVPQMTKLATTAVQAVQKMVDDKTAPEQRDLLENLRSSYSPEGRLRRQPSYGTKGDVVEQVFGAGSPAERVATALQAKDLALAGTIAQDVVGRMDRWGPFSVDAAELAPLRAARQAMGQVADWFKAYQHRLTEFNKYVETETRRTPHEIAERETFWRNEKDSLDKKQNRERITLHEEHKAKIEQLDSHRNNELAQNQQSVAQFYIRAQDRFVAEARRAVPEAQRIARLQRGADEAAARMWGEDGIRQIELNAQRARDDATALYESKRDALAKRHAAEQQQLADRRETQEGYEGPLVRSLRRYQDQMAAYMKAVYDNPSDVYRDMRLDLFNNRLLASEYRSSLTKALDAKLIAQGLQAKDRAEFLRQDPAILAQEFRQVLKEALHGPTWDMSPALAGALKQIDAEVTESAAVELTRLRGLGYRPEWIPTASAFTKEPGRISASLMGEAPHIDAAHERMNDMTGKLHDVGLGLRKDAAQVLRRDGFREVVTEHFAPYVRSDEEMAAWLQRLGLFREYDPSKIQNVGMLSLALKQFGLVEFDPNRGFGFKLPRYATGKFYIPASLVDVVKRLEDENSRPAGVLDKGTDLFRLSILGLSPRYTAHIIFGGGLMLALRSTTHLPQMLVAGARALREGTVPMDAFRNMSFAQDAPLREQMTVLQHAAGQTAGIAAVQENMAQLADKLGTTVGKLAPVHWLRTAAEMNLRFTHYVTELYSAAAYLDYSARAERRGTFLDEVTGKTRTMTPARAREEGIAHVTEVFGNLRAMTPMERYFARRFMPFYGWTKHILRYVASYPFDHPYKAMVLGLIADDQISSIDPGLPARTMEYTLFFGKPNAAGQVLGLDLRFLDPFRDTASYAGLAGWISALNPMILAPAAMLDPSIVYGSLPLYPNSSFDNFYGIDVAGTQGNVLTGLEQYMPQLGGLDNLYQAATGLRTAAQRNPASFWRQTLESLNIPFLPTPSASPKQMAATDEIDRYHVAAAAAQNAFQTGNFSGLAGYSNVPNPLNAEYDITPEQLQAVYNNALAANPGVPPSESLAPPPPPPGL